MTKRQGVIVGVMALFILLVVNAIGFNVEKNVRNICTVSSRYEHRSPNEKFTIYQTITVCPDKDSYTTLLVQDPAASNNYGVIINAPSRYQDREGNTLDPVVFGLRWVDSDRLEVRFPNGLKGHVGQEEEAVDLGSDRFKDREFYGLRVGFVPYSFYMDR